MDDDEGKPKPVVVHLPPAELVTGRYPNSVTVVSDIGARAAQTAREVAHTKHVKPISVTFRWILLLLPFTLVLIALWSWFAKRVLDLDPISIAAGIGALAIGLGVGGLVLKKVLDLKSKD